MPEKKIPIIRDMASQCKSCGSYHFAEALNKDGLCHDCANGKKKEKPKGNNDDYFW